MTASRLVPRASLALAACALLSTLPANSQEWTRFRGPNGNGIGDAPGLPASFSAADFEWIAELPGSGHSSPVLWGAKLFLTASAKEEALHKVLCYDSATGDLLWEWTEPFSPHHKHNFNDFASATPVTDEQAVYVSWTSGEETRVLALDHQGGELWSRSWPGFSSDHGSAASPVLVDGVLIVHTDSRDEGKSQIYGINPADGAELWARERVTTESQGKHTTAYSTPVESIAGDRRCVVLLSTNHGWLGLDPRTGEEIWSHPMVYSFRSVGSIAESGGVVFAALGSGGGGKEATALRLNGTPHPEVIHSYSTALGNTTGLSYVPTPLLHEGLLYLLNDGGVITCRDAATGEEIYQERAGSGQFFSSPVLADGKIFAASRDGVVLVLKAGREFEKLAENKLPSGINATPAIANGRLFLRTDTHLMSLKGR